MNQTNQCRFMGNPTIGIMVPSDFSSCSFFSYDQKTADDLLGDAYNGKYFLDKETHTFHGCGLYGTAFWKFTSMQKNTGLTFSVIMLN